MIARRIKSTLYHFINETYGAFGNPEFISLSKGKDWIRNRHRVNPWTPRLKVRLAFNQSGSTRRNFKPAGKETLRCSWRKKMKFETYGNCFVCGENNPNGLRLNFEIDKKRQTLKTTFVANPTFQGWDGIVHGGIISTLLDEATAKLVYELGYQAVTASLEIRFKKPAPILEPLRVYGEITEVSKRLIRAKARVVKEDGTILATGMATFLRGSLAKAGSP